ncbi:MAG: hypothetical protein ABIC82_04355 [bacterium]
MKKIIKFIGIILAVIVTIFILLVVCANTKKFLYKFSLKNCHGYFSIVAIYKTEQPDVSILQNKINQLNIGVAKIRTIRENNIEITMLKNSVTNPSIRMEEKHQKLLNILNELNLEELEMSSVDDYRSKQCVISE